MNQIGPYQILDKIGEGGMALVFKVQRSPLSQIVALKLMKETVLSLPDLQARFLREARIMAKLKHPNIIQYYDRGEHEKCPFIVCEYADQGDLHAFLTRRPLSLKQRLTIVCEVCYGLEAAHDIGIIHRDIKPGNILLTSQSGAKLSDFGIASALWSTQTQLTKTRDTLGTLDYIAPEQRTSPKQVDFRCDHYAIGVVLYELITCHKPMGFFRPPKQICPNIPDQLNQLVITCLSPEPQNRFASTTELKNNLLEIIRNLPPSLDKPHHHPVQDNLEDQPDTLLGTDQLLRHFESLSLQQKLSYKAQLINQLKQISTSAILAQLDIREGLSKECLIESLLGRKDPAICPFVIDLLSNPYYNEKAVLVLVEQKCREAEDRLLDMISSKNAFSYLAIKPLGQLKSTKAINPISNFLNHEHSWIRALALDALADISQPRCKKLIANQAKNDSDPENRARAQSLLRRYF